MRAGALRRRLYPCARRRAASRHFRLAGGVFAARDARAGGRQPVAVRFRARPVARLSRAEPRDIDALLKAVAKLGAAATTNRAARAKGARVFFTNTNAAVANEPYP